MICLVPLKSIIAGFHCISFGKPAYERCFHSDEPPLKKLIALGWPMTIPTSFVLFSWSSIIAFGAFPFFPICHSSCSDRLPSFFVYFCFPCLPYLPRFAFFLSFLFLGLHSLGFCRSHCHFFYIYTHTPPFSYYCTLPPINTPCSGHLLPCFLFSSPLLSLFLLPSSGEFLRRPPSPSGQTFGCGNVWLGQPLFGNLSRHVPRSRLWCRSQRNFPRSHTLSRLASFEPTFPNHQSYKLWSFMSNGFFRKRRRKRKKRWHSAWIMKAIGMADVRETTTVTFHTLFARGCYFSGTESKETCCFPLTLLREYEFSGWPIKMAHSTEARKVVYGS